MQESNLKNQAPSSEFAVELNGVTKRFDAFVANQSVTLKIRKGSCHALIGENGAGKTTLMKVLFGLYQPDEGSISINGRKVKVPSPRAANALGLGMVHQHFMLGGPFTVLDNIILGHEPTNGFGVLSRATARKRLEEIMKNSSLHVPLDAKIEDLSVGLQQRVEILKLLFQDSNVLILDEPTAVLTPQETQELFVTLKKLITLGKTVLVITHKLKEVMAHSDAVSVLRAGKLVGEFVTKNTTIEVLAETMVGRKLSTPPRANDAANAAAQPALEIANLTLQRDKKSKPLLRNLNLKILPGEIVGIAGVEGNGQDALIHLLNGQLRGTHLAGEGVAFRLFGKDAEIMDTATRKASGLSVIPPDRHHEGLLQSFDMCENFLLGNHRSNQFNKHGIIRYEALKNTTDIRIAEYDIRPANGALSVGSLSGGNQQKLIIAREFERLPMCVVAAHPTRGVDIGAIEFIHSQLLKLKKQGCAILLVSSELDEIFALADRILVMYDGAFTAEFARKDATEQKLGHCMAGGKSQ